MKKNLPVSQQDIPMRESSRIVSTTNLAGQITYANQDFCEISGFNTDELHMQHHNIIRHPDMPQAAYKMLWDKVKSGGSWMGIVKNRCKNGDHYWVDALVTPLKEKGKTIGYQSVRMRPKSEHITNATSLYKKLNGGKTASTFSLGLLAKLYLLVAVVFACSWAPSALLDSKLSALIAAGLATLIFGGGLAFWIAQPWLKAAATSKSIIDDPIAVRTYTGRSDELGQLLLAQHMLHAKLQTVIWRLNDSATELENVSHNTEAIAKGTTEDMNQQQGEVQQVATAMTEMVSTVSEIAANSSAASEAAQSAEANANAGRKVVSEGVEVTQKLSRQVKESAAVIESLKAVADKIGGVVEVIRTIADQTNLLALNAAIEAARAGAQGRGFAVVADEVRSLARKTQSSTDEIQTMIQALQSTVGEAVASMGASEKITESSLQKSAAMEVSLNDILRSIETASNMVLHIATAAEEQGAVAEEINRNIFNINDLSDNTVNSTQKAHTSVNDLGAQISKLKTIVNQFTNNH